MKEIICVKRLCCIWTPPPPPPPVALWGLHVSLLMHERNTVKKQAKFCLGGLVRILDLKILILKDCLLG